MDVNANEKTLTAGRPASAFGFDRLAQLLGGWQATELRAARGFPECRGLSVAQLEDLYQDTALALLSRSYASEEHLRNALRHGIRRRALNMHRDQRRRREILSEHAPSIEREAQSAQTRPEDAVLAAQDRLIAKEFLAELEPLERQVFALTAEGLRYRAIATALRVPVNEARTAARSCERKRARFQLLYETGRLCGYRAETDEALANGRAAAHAVRQAQAHLAACEACKRASVARARVARAGVASVSVGALAWVWGWARRLAGSGGVSAKATAAVMTAAVVASGTLAGTQPKKHPRAVARPDAPLAGGVSPRHGPHRERRPTHSRSEPPVQQPPMLARRKRYAPVSRAVGVAGAAVGVSRAEREFGLER